MHEITIRPEIQDDIPQVQHVIRKAFKSSLFGLQGEDLLVERLRASKAFNADLSLVAALKSSSKSDLSNKIIGHVLVSEVVLQGSDHSIPALALAPLSVLPEYQGRGIGSQLIQIAHQKAAAMEYCCIVLIGHETYYPRFGYVPADRYGITFPFDLPRQNCLLFVLQPTKMHLESAKVTYPSEFLLDNQQ